jgi:hypothetical protein
MLRTLSPNMTMYPTTTYFTISIACTHFYHTAAEYHSDSKTAGAESVPLRIDQQIEIIYPARMHRASVSGRAIHGTTAINNPEIASRKTS